LWSSLSPLNGGDTTTSWRNGPSRIYDNGKDWHDLFLLTRGAGVAPATIQDLTAPVAIETKEPIFSCLLNISEYTVIIPENVISSN
jgi:hypothetical protein